MLCTLIIASQIKLSQVANQQPCVCIVQKQYHSQKQELLMVWSCLYIFVSIFEFIEILCFLLVLFYFYFNDCTFLYAVSRMLDILNKTW